MASQLDLKMKKDGTFRKQMLDVEERYEKEKQYVQYQELHGIHPQLMRYAGQNDNGHDLFFFFGMLQTNNKPRLIQLYIKKFMQQHMQIDRGFILVYFNSNADSYTSYSTFKAIYRTMPLKYFTNLRKLLVVHPSFAIKAFEWMVGGYLNNYLKDRTSYVSSLPHLKEYGIPLSKEIMDCIREDITKIDFPKGYNLAGSLGKNKPKIFTNPVKLAKVEDVMKKHLTEYELADIGVPILLKMLIMYLSKKQQFLKQQGIFRKSISIDDEQEAIKELYGNNFDYLENLSNPHIAAGNNTPYSALIKKMLSLLKEPLIPYVQYGKFINDNGKNHDINYIRNVLLELPPVNYSTLMFLLNFFVKSIISLSNYNKMTHYNVAVVLLPSIMRSQTNSIEDLMYSKKLVLLLEFILKNFYEIFGGKEEQQKVFQERSRISQKIFEENLRKDEIEDMQRGSRLEDSMIQRELPSIGLEAKVFSTKKSHHHPHQFLNQ